MTINPKTNEIVKHLLKGDTNSANRPDIVRRVFEMKKKYLLYVIVQKAIFGKVADWTWSVKYQKRGLPHIHLIVILDKESQPKNVQVPNPDKDKDLDDFVIKLMIQ